jgi:DNA-binding transcriptional regulator YiaG
MQGLVATDPDGRNLANSALNPAKVEFMLARTEDAPANLAKRFHRLVATDRLRELREGCGLSQADVARHMKVAASQVSRWEAGLSRPRPHRIVALLELLEGES